MPVPSRRRPRGEMRQRILRLAAEWLQQRGYHGFSFGQIANALEIQSSAVHYHFPSKADLVSAVFARYRVEFAWWREQMGHSRYGPLEQVGRFLDLEARNIEGERVCPLGVAGVEYASLPAEACAEAEGLRDDLADWLTATLDAGRLEGRLDFPGDAGDQARVIMAAAQGALQLVRLHGREDFAAVRRAILTGLTPRGV